MRGLEIPGHLELLLTGEPVLDIYAVGPWRVPDGLVSEVFGRARELAASGREARRIMVKGDRTRVKIRNQGSAGGHTESGRRRDATKDGRKRPLGSGRAVSTRSRHGRFLGEFESGWAATSRRGS
jgi:hypothetical protein